MMALVPVGKTSRKVVFDPKKHLSFQPPKSVWSMKSLGLKGAGVSPVAVSEPFGMFTPEGVKEMRSEIFSKPVLDNCSYTSNLAAHQLRGLAPDYAPFIYDAWHNEEVLQIVSRIAGMDLVPVMNFEIANIYLSSDPRSKEEGNTGKSFAERVAQQHEGVPKRSAEDISPIVDWHTDSYPFVCIVMLSDCTNMRGGETALRTGNGDVMTVRGPAIGNAVVLQGRYIEHQTLRAFGVTECITMVTSFRPRSASLKDDSVLTTVRAVSDLPELYSQFAEYRLEMIEERARNQLRKIRENKKAHRRFDLGDTKAFLGEQIELLQSTLDQMVDEEQVTAGFVDETHLISDDLILAHLQKATKYIHG